MDKIDARQPATAQTPQRQFGRLVLRHVLGKGQGSTTWLAHDPAQNVDVLLCMPRVQPAGPAALEAWKQSVSRAARLKHPRLAPLIEQGVMEGWPFAVYERGLSVSLTERAVPGQKAVSVLEAVQWGCEMLEALAYVHDAGGAHLDLEMHNVLVSPAGRISVAGFGVAWAAERVNVSLGPARMEPRLLAERDILMTGLLLHRLLAGHPPLDDADLYSAAARVGPEIVLLPRGGGMLIPDTLRAIVNRATDRQPRQRYLNARTLAQALESWLTVNQQESSGPLALILDRLNAVGHLPSRHRHFQHLQTEVMKDGLRVDDMADLLLSDPAMVFELLRTMHAAKVNGSEEPTNSVSRAISMLGVWGVRQIMGTVRSWPGVLGAQSSLQGDQAGAAAMSLLARHLQLAVVAGLTARWLRPFNIGDEDVMVAAMAQRLGWLLIAYHFPEEAAQIERLMLSDPGAAEVGAASHGMSRPAAVGAVLGVDPDELSAAVLKHWGFSESLIQAARPLPLDASPRRPLSADEWLRTVASQANELVGLIGTTGVAQQRALTAVVSRYARATVTTQQEMVDALQHAIRQLDGTAPREAPRAPARRQEALPDTEPAPLVPMPDQTRVIDGARGN